MKSIKLLMLIVTVASAMVYAQEPVTPTTGGSSGSGTSSTIVPPESFPLTTALRKAYALTQVDHIGGSTWAPSASGKPYFNVPYVGGPDPLEMAKVASSQKLNISVDPSDPIQTSLQYRGTAPHWDGTHGSIDYDLFTGNNNAFLVQINGVYQLPKSAYQIDLELGDWMPFPAPGVQYAQMELTDDNGESYWYSFDQDNRFNREGGYLILGNEHMNQDGRLLLHYPNDVVQTYDTITGQKIPTVPFTFGGLEGTINGVRTVTVAVGTITGVVCSADDEVIFLKVQKSDVPTVRTGVQILYAPGISADRRPVAWFAITAKKLAADPLSKWEGPITSELIFQLEQGSDVFLRFERKPKFTAPQNNSEPVKG